MSSAIRAIRGMNDVLPDQAHLWEFFEDSAKRWLARYGYRTIRLPLIEKTDLFVRAIGAVTDIVEKEMYSFVDLNGESLTLRPEGTASCVRAAIEHNLLHNAQQRLCYSGPMFRHERPQKGRYRQFHQIGVEALGFTGPDIDAEQIIMTAALWRELGVDRIALQLNTLGSLDARLAYRERLVAYLEQNYDALDEDSRRRVRQNPLRVLDSKNPALVGIIAGAPKLLDDLDDAALRHFERLQATVRDAGVAFEINPNLVRGLDYYNFTVFEWVTDRLGAQGTICAGGRYDGLIEQIGGKPTPACGFAIGVERVLALLAARDEEIPVPAPDVYLVHQGEAASRFAWRAAADLRGGGVQVVMHCGGGNFKAQMKKADASGARYAVIIGDDEAQAGELSLKPLRGSGEQLRTAIGEALHLIRTG